MGLILGKSKALKPKPMKEIKALVSPEKKATEIAVQIAKAFGQQSKKMKPKKFILR
jgi:hypothetical protein